MDRLYYLASPFTHPEDKVRRRRARQATVAAIKLLRLGIDAFSPISYNSSWSRGKWHLPVEWPFWERYDKNFLRRCDAVIVLLIDGWDISVGVTAEVEYAKTLGMPVFHKTMKQIEAGDIQDILDFNNSN